MKKFDNTKIAINNDINIDNHDFYRVVLKKGVFSHIRIDRVKFIEKIKQMGFYRYDTDEDGFVMIKIEDNKLKRVSEKTITDEFIKFITEINPKTHKLIETETETEITIDAKLLLPCFYENLETYFTKKLLERATPEKAIQLQNDEIDKKYIYFKNCFIEINSNEVLTHDYTKLNNYVWNTQIIEHDFKYNEEKGNFEKFIENLSNKDIQRKKSLMSLIGYLLHGYFDYKLHFVLFTDSDISSTGEANGRTGKTLLGKALSYVLNASKTSTGYMEVDGKTFVDLKEKKYQSCDVDTKLVHINDIFSYFKIENLFTDITEGITVKKLYDRPFFIHSKLMGSTNKSIILDGASAKDRVVVYEVANHYNENFTPEMEFKQWFFRDWNNQEWDKFYSFMIKCCKLFLENGIIRTEEINYSERVIIEHTAPDFVGWIDYQIKTIYEEMKITNTDAQRSKKFFYTQFIEEYVDYKYKKNFSQIKLTKWIKKYFHFKQINYSEARSTEDIFIINYDNLKK